MYLDACGTEYRYLAKAVLGAGARNNPNPSVGTLTLVLEWCNEVHCSTMTMNKASYNLTTFGKCLLCVPLIICVLAFPSLPNPTQLWDLLITSHPAMCYFHYFFCLLGAFSLGPGILSELLVFLTELLVFLVVPSWVVLVFLVLLWVVMLGLPPSALPA